MRFEHSYAYEPGSDPMSHDHSKSIKFNPNQAVMPESVSIGATLRTYTPVSELFSLIDNNIDLSRQISSQIAQLTEKLDIALKPATLRTVDIGSMKDSLSAVNTHTEGKSPLENKLINCNIQLHNVLLELESLASRVSL